MYTKSPEINPTIAQATTPLQIINHILNTVREPSDKRHAQRLSFLEKHLCNLSVIGGEPHILVEVFDDDEAVEPDDYNLASLKALDLDYTTTFEPDSAATILATVVNETHGTLLIGVPLSGLWELDRSLHDKHRPTGTQQLLGAMAVHSHPTR